MAGSQVGPKGMTWRLLRFIEKSGRSLLLACPVVISHFLLPGIPMNK